MTTAQNQSQKMESFYREEASKRWATVLASPEFEGREKLASTMLTNTTLSADEIVLALSKAPKPGASESIPQREQQDDPVIEAFGPPSKSDIFDPVLMAKGAAAAKWLLNK